MNQSLADEYKRRPRFSLLSLVLTTTTIAAVLALFVSERRNAKIRVKLQGEVLELTKDIRRLRNEVGELDVTDPTKVNLILAPSNESLTWKWRVWVPKGKSYTLRATGGDVPKTGFPDAMGIPFNGRHGEPDELWCEYKVRKNLHKGIWEQTLRVSETGTDEMAGSGSGSFLTWPIEEPFWLEQPESVAIASTDSNVSEWTTSYQPNQPVVLLRYRVAKEEPISKRSAGVMVWFEPSR